MALPLVFDYLADPKLNVRRAGISGFWALSKGSISHIASHSLCFLMQQKLSLEKQITTQSLLKLSLFPLKFITLNPLPIVWNVCRNFVSWSYHLSKVSGNTVNTCPK